MTNKNNILISKYRLRAGCHVGNNTQTHRYNKRKSMTYATPHPFSSLLFNTLKDFYSIKNKIFFHYSY